MGVRSGKHCWSGTAYHTDGNAYQVQGTAVLPGMPCHTYHRGRFVGTENGGYRGVAIDGVVADNIAAGPASVVVAGGTTLVAATSPVGQAAAAGLSQEL